MWHFMFRVKGIFISGVRKNRTTLFPLYFLIALGFTACGKELPEDKALAKINGYTITLNEFENQLAADLEMNPDFKLTRKAKEDFLDQLIQKEILIQEAMKLKLDRKDPFVKAIERYWQSTLIRDLIELKGEEISRRIVISEEEIQARFNDMKTSGEEIEPMDVTRERVLNELKEEKKRKELREWVQNIKKTKKIEINQELL